MSISQLSPSASDFDSILKKTIDEIQPGQRVQILIPRSISHADYKWDGCRDWDMLQAIHLKFCDYIVDPNVFMALRFDHKTEVGDVIIDVCNIATK